MALTLCECLREARRIPNFNGEDNYTLQNYLRDVSTILSLSPEDHQATVKIILANKLQGKALRAVDCLTDPTWDNIIQKLRREFGVNKTYFHLREEALNIRVSNIEELHNKLETILNTMNTKYSLELIKDENYKPINNSQIIFGIYTNFIPTYIRALLLQNNIDSISAAYNYYVENNLIKDIILKKCYDKKTSYDGHFNHKNFNRNSSLNQNNNFKTNHNNNSFVLNNKQTNNRSQEHGYQNRSQHFRNPNVDNQSGRYPNRSHNFGSHNFRNQTRGNFQSNRNDRQPEPMEVDTVNVQNFRQSCLNPNYR